MPHGRTAKRRLRLTRHRAAEVIALLGVLALALLLRVVDLRGLPYVLMGDESKFALQARAFNQGLLFRPFQTAIDGHWGLWFMVLGVFTRLFGETTEAIRLQAAIFGTLSILATYALTRLLWGRRPALIAAALLATYHFHIHFSRIAMNNIYDAVFSMLIFGSDLAGLAETAPLAVVVGRTGAGAGAVFLHRWARHSGGVGTAGPILANHRSGPRQSAGAQHRAGSRRICRRGHARRLLRASALRRIHDALSIRPTFCATAGWKPPCKNSTSVPWKCWGSKLRDTIQVFVAGSESFFYQGQSLLTPAMSVLVCAGLLYLLWHIKEGRAFCLVIPGIDL